MSTSIDSNYMRQCLALAEKGRFGASPNPVVGSVIVKDGEVVGSGWHQRAGGPHAEINALEMAGQAARGADIYVSLEPCSHWGKTGPCCEAVIEAGVKRLIYAMQDPNPRVAGQGLQAIRGAGIAVDGPVLEAEARALNPGFIKRMETGLPLVRCKLAMSLDGRTAMASGESKWITGAEARADVQYWRARSGAVITGVETVLADDPALNARHQDVVVQPLRVVVDSHLRTPAKAALFRQPGLVLIATAITNPELLASKRHEYSAAGVANLNILTLAAPGDNRVDLDALLSCLAEEYHCNEVLLESGARLAGAMVAAGLVDEMITYVAPKLLGSEARPLLHLPGLASMAQQIALEIIDVAMVGKDCRMRSRLLNVARPMLRT